MGHREESEALATMFNDDRKMRMAKDADQKRDEDGKFGAGGGGGSGAKETDTSKAMKEHNGEKYSKSASTAESHGYEESGGGGGKGDGPEFTTHSNGNRHVYVKDDGSWEHHDLDRQHNDESKSAVGRGKDSGSLDKHLTKFKKTYGR